MLAHYMVPLIGVEPIRYHYHRILSPARLPVSPRRRKIEYIINHSFLQLIFIILYAVCSFIFYFHVKIRSAIKISKNDTCLLFALVV